MPHRGRVRRLAITDNKQSLLCGPKVVHHAVGHLQTDKLPSLTSLSIRDKNTRQDKLMDY